MVFLKLQAVHHRMPAPEFLHSSASWTAKVTETTADDYAAGSVMIEANISESILRNLALSGLRSSCWIYHYHRHGAPWNVHCHLLRRETALTKHVPDSHQSAHVVLTIETYALFPNLSRVSI
ncbi:hypothetical protein CY34DRAFT_600471 [Suillus luteus UH-Slu-Lm8-n1]|uniref:Uncharacterized protein n=1 Tax=Suillus luteus UH-Slu-Lm8-n1 TaxID=930992 RepID=A0A0C9ZC38_9AGAM|nr:hypothetical protein CY34DRAFT_600471 [Suillus luteus UH-Slu-Lm8-n1]